MKEFFSSLKKGILLVSLICIVLGLIMIIFPEAVGNMICYIIGIVLIFCGLITLVPYFIHGGSTIIVESFLPAILALATGLLFLIRPDVILSVLWLCVGIGVLVDSIFKIQYASNLKNAGSDSWWINLLTAGITLVLSIILMFQPAKMTSAVVILMGVTLLVNGISDLISVVQFSTNANALRKKLNMPYEGTYTTSDKDDENK